MGTPGHVIPLLTHRLTPRPSAPATRRRPFLLLRVRRAQRIAQKALLGERA